MLIRKQRGQNEAPVPFVDTIGFEVATFDFEWLRDLPLTFCFFTEPLFGMTLLVGVT